MNGPVTKERRWIVLAADGRHSTLGRDSDPREEEIARVTEGLRQLGQGGWLAVLEGRYYSRDRLTLMMVRELGAPSQVPWKTAVEAFLAARRNSTTKLATPSPS